MPQHLENWVEDVSRGRLIREIETVQSEWPAHTSATFLAAANTSGYETPSQASIFLLLSVPSGFWFKMRTLIVDNETAVMNNLEFYCGSGMATPGAATQSIFAMHIGGNETQFIGLDCITVGKDLYVYASHSNCHVRVGGFLIASGNEYGQE
jgi:hypothetical protein